MRFHSSHRWFPGILPGAPEPRALEDQTDEVRRVVKRLLALLDEHQEQAVRLKTDFSRADAVAVIDALLAEADRNDPRPWLKTTDPMHEYLRCTLYDEWLGESEQRALYHAGERGHGALRGDAWQCVENLPDHLAPVDSAGSTLPTKPPRKPPMTPLILLTGFLGSGKTTLLRQLIPLLAARNLAPCVILNDYRNAHLEAETLRNLTDQIVPIGGTCVCCDSRYPLMEALSSATLTDRSVMLLEANGTADAPELIELLSADPGVARYTLPVQVAVVDVQRWQKRYFHNKLERSQVPTAGYLVLTRATEVPAFRLQQVTDELAAIAPRATRQTPDTLADLMTELTLSAHHLPARRFSAGTAMPPAHHPRHRHSAQHHFSSCELRLPPRVDLEDLRTFLTGLPPEVIRAKGVAYENNAANTPWYFQKVEGRDEVTFHRIDAQIVYDPVMILIGVLINPADYRVPLAALGAAADPVP